MFAVWEYNADTRHLISQLNFLQDLMALKLCGKLFHNSASLWQKLHFAKLVQGLGRANLFPCFLVRSLC